MINNTLRTNMQLTRADVRHLSSHAGNDWKLLSIEPRVTPGVKTMYTKRATVHKSQNEYITRNSASTLPFINVLSYPQNDCVSKFPRERSIDLPPKRVERGTSVTNAGRQIIASTWREIYALLGYIPTIFINSKHRTLAHVIAVNSRLKKSLLS